MQTKVLILFSAFFIFSAHSVHAEIRWGVPPQYTQPETTPPPNPNPPSDDVDATPSIDDQPALEPSAPPSKKDDADIEAQLNQEVRILWDEINEMEKRQNDITILPIETPEPPPELKPNPKPKTHIKNDKERIDTLLHSTKDKNGKTVPLPKEVEAKIKENRSFKEIKDLKDLKDTKKGHSATVNAPQLTAQPKPVLTRKQVLEQEIAREKAALKSALTQLQIARKRGNAAQAQKLMGIIRDRELNVQAISRELTR